MEFPALHDPTKEVVTTPTTSTKTEKIAGPFTLAPMKIDRAGALRPEGPPSLITAPGVLESTERGEWEIVREKATGRELRKEHHDLTRERDLTIKGGNAVTFMGADYFSVRAGERDLGVFVVSSYSDSGRGKSEVRMRWAGF